jgi:hypothetical protein
LLLLPQLSFVLLGFMLFAEFCFGFEYPDSATRRFWLDFVLFRKQLEWKYWSVGLYAGVQVMIYVLILTKNRLPASRIEKYAGNCCFEFTIESSELIIVFVLLQHGWSED